MHEAAVDDQLEALQETKTGLLTLLKDLGDGKQKWNQKTSLALQICNQEIDKEGNDISNDVGEVEDLEKVGPKSAWDGSWGMQGLDLDRVNVESCISRRHSNRCLASCLNHIARTRGEVETAETSVLGGHLSELERGRLELG